MKVAVVGLGKIGLPLAVQVASAGHEVIGADRSPAVVDLIRRGEPPFPNEAELVERLGAAVRAGSLVATTGTPEAVAESDVVLVVVPLVVDEEGRPDFAMLDDATADIGPALRPGTLVSYETTLPVHTTRRRFVPALQEASGLTAGHDLFVCHSPERVLSGRVFADLRRYPKLVGGVDHESGRRAAAFYASALQFDERTDLVRPNGVWDLGTAEAAELAKLVETTYRDVNIALANEFARFADSIDIDVHAVIDAANSQPFSHVHRPGVAVGGHCIPIYPRFYLAGDPMARLPAVARDINLSMPEYAVDRLDRATESLAGKLVVVLGASYRGGVKESAFSGVFPLVEALQHRGARVAVHDPLYDDAELRALGLTPFVPGSRAEAAVLQADHDCYLRYDAELIPDLKVLLDGRGVIEESAWPGVTVIGLGRPGGGESPRGPSP